MKCFVCGKELHGGLDTFGAVGEEMCQSDYLALVTENYDPPDDVHFRVVGSLSDIQILSVLLQNNSEESA